MNGWVWKSIQNERDAKLELFRSFRFPPFSPAKTIFDLHYCTVLYDVYESWVRTLALPRVIIWLEEHSVSVVVWFAAILFVAGARTCSCTWGPQTQAEQAVAAPGVPTLHHEKVH